MAGPLGRLPPPPLNVQPAGLLDFFQVKNGGEYPQILGTVLQPVLEMREHYFQTNGEYSDITGTAVATGDNSRVILSAAGNFWRYFNYLSWEFVPLNALDAFIGWPALFSPNAQNARMLPFTPVSQDTASVRSYWRAPADATLRPVAGCVDGGFWVPPGFGVGLWQFAAVSTGGLATFRHQRSIVAFRS